MLYYVYVLTGRKIHKQSGFQQVNYLFHVKFLLRIKSTNFNMNDDDYCRQ